MGWAASIRTNTTSASTFTKIFSTKIIPRRGSRRRGSKDQDKDGVAAEVLFASVGRFFYGLTDGPFQRAIFRSYNAWLHEFCSYDPKRLIGVPLISILEPQKAAEDIREYAKLGFKAAQIPYAIKDGGYFDRGLRADLERRR